jgi:hypothetical protein
MKRKVRRETNKDKNVFSLTSNIFSFSLLSERTIYQDKHQPAISRNHRGTCSIQKNVRMVSAEKENMDKNIHKKDLWLSRMILKSISKNIEYKAIWNIFFFQENDAYLTIQMRIGTYIYKWTKSLKKFIKSFCHVSSRLSIFLYVFTRKSENEVKFHYSLKRTFNMELIYDDYLECLRALQDVKIIINEMRKNKFLKIYQ